MRYRLQRHDGTDCSATMVPITVLRMVPIQRYRHTKMNWNSFNLYTKLPATIDTSNTLAQVGNLLRQYNGVTYDYRFFI